MSLCLTPQIQLKCHHFRETSLAPEIRLLSLSQLLSLRRGTCI